MDADLLSQLAGGKQRRLELLQAIAASGSITHAAKAVGLSYKGAWSTVETMNNLAGEPLVHRVAGGRGGGGTRLTTRGQELLDLYERLQTERRSLVARIERERRGASRDLPVLGRLAMLSSARNQLAGRVTHIKTGAVNDEVDLEIGGDNRIRATITRESTRTLRLQAGTPITALIKAPWIMLAAGTPAPLACSADNQLHGRVRRVARGAVNAEVVLELAGGQTLAAIVTNASVDALGLRRSAPAIALFSAASVILVRLD
ncbi:TOBE domain-containing protein [Sinimarinibacterium flocculans]|uniref:Molybdate transport system regulatory protein n=1 Tax=Sinimarinibacterium flocculans TaxID=985250 RepID=A0A318E3H1_9GAMM|nr:TOBE domain-containing protein [Sinimarinibacterium flocculans]PXV65698.1 molybdate transport system regulatory protein [Sinimarinibacterium flocculans]